MLKVTLANNATPGLYSCAPWSNPSMWLVWFYLFFIAASQMYVLASMLIINPPVVDTRTWFVDCERGTPAAAMALLTAEECHELEVAFELPVELSKGGDAPIHLPVHLRRFEQNTYYCTLALLPYRH
jgi:hypothetical protein